MLGILDRTPLRRDDVAVHRGQPCASRVHIASVTEVDSPYTGIATPAASPTTNDGFHDAPPTRECLASLPLACAVPVPVRHSMVAQHHDPQQEYADVDALPQPDPRRGQIGLQTRSLHECQRTKYDEHHDASRWSNRRNGFPNAEAPNPIARNMRKTVTPPRTTCSGVAQRASTGGKHLALVHCSERPQQPERCVRQDEAADDSHGAISTGGSPQAQPESGRPARCRSSPSRAHNACVGAPIAVSSLGT